MSNVSQSQSLGHLTGLASRLFNRLLTTRFKQAGVDMTAEQWGIILTIHTRAEPLTQKLISDILYLEKSSVSRSINVLVNRGWLVCQPCEQDSRKKLVQLTPLADGVVSQCSAIAQSVLDDAQQQLSDVALSDSCTQLGTVIDNLRQLIPPFANESIIAISTEEKS
ncbi:MarR family winged helix-turn-helix transcriptional regulator [Shewanella mangrovi]|uniref:MarR family winged helix-turn-helix transcriptional regulator n=1 Tax=Shewanella mangrovi TaxID=1515746 RepID=UPI00068C1C8C|nr:MarR family transcriptional regulator [Shewanella mangrovi]